jgi:signal transduction histidine kinase
MVRRFFWCRPPFSHDDHRNRRQRLDRVLKTDRSVARRLNEHLSVALHDEAGALALRWRTQGRAIAPGSPVLEPDAEGATEVLRVLDAIARSLVGDARWQDDLIRAGWTVGAEEFRLGASLHALLKQLDLLEAMILYVLEGAASSPAGEGMMSSDGIATARRIQRARSLLSLAAVKGFTEAYLDEVRARHRMLRHDLRNPLGTIRTAVSLMEDESIPADMRANPRFRTMVKRNASTIDSMIGIRLSDDTTHDEVFAWHDVSLADVARAVRRDLREDATEAGCEIVVDGSLPTLRMDAMGVELVLRAIVSAVLRGAEPQTSITIGPAKIAGSSVAVAVRADTPVHTIVHASQLELAEQIAKRIAGRVWIEDEVYLELPFSVAHERENVAGAHE